MSLPWMSRKASPPSTSIGSSLPTPSSTVSPSTSSVAGGSMQSTPYRTSSGVPQNPYANIGNGTGPSMTAAQAYANQAATAAQTQAAQAYNAAQGYAQQGLDGVQNYAQQGVTGVQNYANQAATSTQNYVNQANTAAQSYANQAASAVGNYANQAAQTVNGYANQAADTANGYTAPYTADSRNNPYGAPSTGGAGSFRPYGTTPPGGTSSIPGSGGYTNPYAPAGTDATPSPYTSGATESNTPSSSGYLPGSTSDPTTLGSLSGGGTVQQVSYTGQAATPGEDCTNCQFTPTAVPQ